MTTEKRAIIKRHYADTSNRDLADMLQCSVVYVKKTAHRMGLVKNEAYTRKMRVEQAAYARYQCRKTGFKRVSEAHRKDKYDNVYERLTEIGDRYRQGESSVVLASELGCNRKYLSNILNRHGYYFNKAV